VKKRVLEDIVSNKNIMRLLQENGVPVVAMGDEIVAALIWGVEGVEKIPKYGKVLFYVVNGTRYGVKPTKGNLRDIDWYSEQISAALKASKGYSTALTQFLNTWIHKKELEVVFKGKASSTITSSVNDMDLPLIRKEFKSTIYRNVVESYVSGTEFTQLCASIRREDKGNEFIIIVQNLINEIIVIIKWPDGRLMKEKSFKTEEDALKYIIDKHF
jgi:hypothetical protein